MLLAGDVGGTKTILAQYEKSTEGLERVRERLFPSADYASLDDIVAEFLSDQSVPLEAACFGSDAWSEQALEQALSDKNALYLSCMEEGRLIACCGIWQSFEDGDITNVAVEEGSRRKGCGTAEEGRSLG